MPRRAFSMIELVIVVVIIAILGAIAAPRFNGMAERAKGQRLIADLNTLQKAAELFAAEHRGLSVGKNAAGTAVAPATLIARLTETSDDTAAPNPAGLFGPYLREIPANTINGLSTVRVNGAPAGAGTHGWRFVTNTGAFQADTTISVVLQDGSIATHEGLIAKAGGALGALEAD